MPDWLLALMGVAVTLALGVLTWTATRRSGDRERISKLEERVDALDGRNKRKDDYIGVLRQHINDGKAPPPPPYPADLFE